jgi:hypothetical protein
MIFRSLPLNWIEETAVMPTSWTTTSLVVSPAVPFQVKNWSDKTGQVSTTGTGARSVEIARERFTLSS